MNHLGDTNKMVGEDHIRDATKMVSDTPMTDAHIDGLRRDPEVSGCDRTLDFCRQLEREINRACEMYRKLDIHALNLIDRIWRLEDAGDKAILNSYLPDRISMWNKAKEDKP